MANQWEYAIVELMNSYGSQYRMNGNKVPQWKDKPMYEVLQNLGAAGWELTTFDGTQYIFKRPCRTGDGAHEHRDLNLHHEHPAEQAPQQAGPN